MLFIAGMALLAHQTPSLSVGIIPKPVSFALEEGSFKLGPKTSIVAGPALQGIARQLREDIRPATGLTLPVVVHAGDDAIHLELDHSLSKLGPEGYTLTVRSNRVDIKGYQPAGVFYGMQTFRQLFPPQISSQSRVNGVDWDAQCVTVMDKPRFGWRGMHIDVGRHFMPKEFLFKFIDLISMQKMNVLHLHLTEDQGWRIQIKRYPKLTSVGGWRKESQIGPYAEHKFDGKPHGGFYTQTDLREIVRYADERYVRVMPEIEMPGHSQAAIASYPELGTTGKPVDVWTEWGVSENVFNTEDSTIHFLQNVLTEVMQIFHSEFIHIGGDECPKDQWKASPAAQAKMKQLGLKSEEELQSWFIQQMDRFLTLRGRRLVGWDEILEGGLAPGATVMSWRGEKGGIAAAKSGHDVVMAPMDFTYLSRQSTDLPLQKVYGYEPVPSGLTADEAKHVLGAQGELWSEHIPDPKQAEYMAFPRACALAEVLWSPRTERSYDDFLARLKPYLERLSLLDVNYRRLDDTR